MVLPINTGISSDLLKLFRFRTDQFHRQTTCSRKNLYRQNRVDFERANIDKTAFDPSGYLITDI
jgi:hypothetical protein